MDTVTIEDAIMKKSLVQIVLGCGTQCRVAIDSFLESRDGKLAPFQW